MRSVARTTDYDGTLATEGEVFDETVAALDRCRESARRIIDRTSSSASPMRCQR